MPDSPEQNTAPTSLFFSDQPTIKDQLGRERFVESIADQIKSLDFKDPFVIGLYGKWGIGKTSVIMMLKEVIKKKYGGHFDSMDFNPWRYRGEEMLLLDFFKALLKATGNNKKKSVLKKLTKGISDYSAAITIPTVALDGGVTFAAAKVAQPVLKQISNFFNKEKTLEDQKKIIDEALNALAVHVIVYVDDIDRLNNHEIRQLFKLIKLTANFQRLRYVLVFDEDIVARAIGEDYGQGTPEEGKAYLEKIIQLPIRIPEPDPRDHYSFTRALIDEWLKSNGIAVRNEDLPIFEKCFKKLHESFVETPRDSKRLLNAIIFSEKCLSKEVNVLDLILLETIRLFAQPFYHYLIRNPNLFIPSMSSFAFSFDEIRIDTLVLVGAEETVALEAEMKKEIEIPQDAWGAISYTINKLFPQNSIFNPSTQDGQYDLAEYTRRQKVALGDYFKRYIQYNIDTGVIPDSEFEKIAEEFGEKGYSELSDKVVRLLNYSTRSVYKNIEARMEVLPPNAAKNFSIFLGLNPDYYLEQAEGFGNIITRRNGFLVIFNSLIQIIENVEGMQEVVRSIVQSCPSPQYACELLNLLLGNTNPETEESLRLPEEWREFIEGQINELVQRVLTMDFTELGIGEQAIQSDLLLYWIYATGNGDQFRDQTIAFFNEAPENILIFMEGIIPPTVSGNGDRSYLWANHDRHFQVLEGYVPREVIQEKLLDLFPNYRDGIPLRIQDRNLNTEEGLVVQYLRFVAREKVKPEQEINSGDNIPPEEVEG